MFKYRRKDKCVVMNLALRIQKFLTIDDVQSELNERNEVDLARASARLLQRKNKFIRYNERERGGERENGGWGIFVRFLCRLHLRLGTYADFLS